MTTAASKNGAGTPRKQLSEQLDRLDSVIDALDEGLKGAVADAVREAVRDAVDEAVQAVLLRVLTDPDLQRMMRQAAPAEQTRKEKEEDRSAKSGSLLSRLWGKTCSAAHSCVEGVGTALRLARVGWGLAGSKTRTLVLAGVAAVAGASYAAREKIVSAARVVADFVTTRGGRLLARLAPRLSR